MADEDNATPTQGEIAIWDAFAQSYLVSGAWRDMPWEDLPERERAEFIELLRSRLRDG